MQPLALEIVYRGQTWLCKALSAAGTEVTLQIMSHMLVWMPASVLEFSLWDARCKQIPDLVLSEQNIELLRPWLRKQGCPWRIGWKRKTTKAKEPKQNPKQMKLFGGEG